jgi:hypothetical protein
VDKSLQSNCQNCIHVKINNNNWCCWWWGRKIAKTMRMVGRRALNTSPIIYESLPLYIQEDPQVMITKKQKSRKLMRQDIIAVVCTSWLKIHIHDPCPWQPLSSTTPDINHYHLNSQLKFIIIIIIFLFAILLIKFCLVE